jgi:hypothetical protein
MTPDEAQKLLQESGYFSRWEGRQLVGASTYKPGNPGVFEGAHFVIRLVEHGVSEATVTDFDGQHQTFDNRSLEIIVACVLQELDRIMGNKIATHVVDPWLAIQLGQALPTATSEVDALSRLFISDEDAEHVRSTINKSGPKSRPVPPPFTEEERLRFNEPPAPPKPWAPPLMGEPEAKRTAVASNNIVAYGYTRTFQAAARDFFWRPLEQRTGWSSPLHHIPGFGSLSTVREMSLVLLTSAIRQVLDDLPGWLELIVFSADEPVDGNVLACLVATKTEPSVIPKPKWLEDLLSTKRQPSRRKPQ